MSESDSKTEQSRSWLERLSMALTGEPSSRAELLEVLRASEQRELLDAEALLTSGFVHEVLPDRDGLMARANQLAERMKQMAPLTIQASLEGLLRLRQAAPLPDDDDLIEQSYVSADFAEGVRAFLEKRKPQWQGK